MKQLLIVASIALGLSSCKNRDPLVGYAIEEQTQKPLANYVIRFKYSSSTSSIDPFGGGPLDQYISTITDENGKFKLDVKRKYRQQNFYVAEGPNTTRSHCSDDESMRNSKYFVDPWGDPFNYTNTTLHFYPKGRTYFSIERDVFEDLGVDTIKVVSPFDDIIFIKPYEVTTNNGNPFMGLPDEFLSFQFLAIKNGEIKNQIDTSIYTVHQCDENVQYTEIKF